jgi:pyruvate kinase
MDIMKKSVVACKKAHRVEWEDVAAVVADKFESDIC